ncbi:hypothetical protein, partial [Actinobacillus pleuropneumoniae]|uniref:hypothetical protein n=1 Tax=Actinobacillus pleuropneumoniae TaxID=715 RepID=UPI00227AC1AA
MKGLTFQTVRRKVNGLANHLANFGADNPNIVMNRCWHEIDNPIIKKTCEQMAATDLIHATQP